MLCTQSPRCVWFHNKRSKSDAVRLLVDEGFPWTMEKNGSLVRAFSALLLATGRSRLPGTQQWPNLAPLKPPSASLPSLSLKSRYGYLQLQIRKTLDMLLKGRG